MQNNTNKESMHNTLIGSNFGPNIQFPVGFEFDQRPQHYYKRFEGEEQWCTYDPCQFITPNFFETITFEQLNSGNFDSGVRLNLLELKKWMKIIDGIETIEEIEAWVKKGNNIDKFKDFNKWIIKGHSHNMLRTFCDHLLNQDKANEYKNMYKKYICKQFIHNKLDGFWQEEMCKGMIFESFVSNYVPSRDCVEAQQLEALQHLSEEVKDFEKLFDEPSEELEILEKINKTSQFSSNLETNQIDLF